MPTTGDHPEVRPVTYPTRAWIAMGLFGTLMLGLLSVQLASILDQRAIAARQERRAERLINAAEPQARAVDAATPALAAGLRRADRLARGLQDAEAPEAIEAAGELATGLDRADAAGALAATGRLAQALAADDRAVDLVDRARTLVASLSARNTPGDVEATRRIAADLLALARDLKGTQDAALERLTSSLDVQRQTLAVLQESFAVQQEVLRHARSLDRKLGGELPSR